MDLRVMDTSLKPYVHYKKYAAYLSLTLQQVCKERDQTHEMCE